jgi:hypothetical protein
VKNVDGNTVDGHLLFELRSDGRAVPRLGSVQGARPSPSSAENASEQPQDAGELVTAGR